MKQESSPSSIDAASASPLPLQATPLAISKASLWRRGFLAILYCIAALMGALAIAWACGAIYFDGPLHSSGGNAALALFWLALVLSVACSGLFARRLLLVARACWLASLRGRLAAILALWLAVLFPWLAIRPTGERDWPAQWAQTASAEVVDDEVTLHNVRHFSYQAGGGTDEAIASTAVAHWETRQVHLSNLQGVDLFLTYWGSPFIAHSIVSFDFGVDGHVAFSVETRADRSQAYSPIAGLYRQYELIYVVADERDVIRLRTSYRKGEEVYLYRLKIAPDAARIRFKEYLAKINALHSAPEFYNVITANCTTSIRAQIAAADRLPLNWRLLLNGTMDAWLYHSGALKPDGLSFNELKERAHINPQAKAAGDASDFSERIRWGVPGFDCR